MIRCRMHSSFIWNCAVGLWLSSKRLRGVAWLPGREPNRLATYCCGMPFASVLTVSSGRQMAASLQPSPVAGVPSPSMVPYTPCGWIFAGGQSGSSGNACASAKPFGGRVRWVSTAEDLTKQGELDSHSSENVASTSTQEPKGSVEQENELLATTAERLSEHSEPGSKPSGDAIPYLSHDSLEVVGQANGRCADTAEDPTEDSEQDSESHGAASPSPSQDSTGTQRQRIGRYAATPEYEVRVSGTSFPRSVAAAIAGNVRRYGKCCVLCTGAHAVNQVVKSIAVARGYVRTRDKFDLLFRPGHRSKQDMSSSTRMFFWVTARKGGLFEQSDVSDISKVKNSGSVISLGAALKHSAQVSGFAGIRGVGVGAVAHGIVGMTWARRLLLETGKDVNCYADFTVVNLPSGEKTGMTICLEVDQNDQASTAVKPQPVGESELSLHEKYSAYAVEQVDRLLLPFSELKPGVDAFTSSSLSSLPTVKVSRESETKVVAAALFTQLRISNGCQVLASGPIAINQAVKAMTTARIYTKDHDGYDMAVQCLHAPRQERTGNCQVSFTIRLVKPEKVLKEPEVYKVASHSSGEHLGGALAGSTRERRNVKLVAIGVQAVARSVVGFSYARSFLENDGFDLVFFPSFLPVELSLGSEVKPGWGIAFQCHFGSFKQVISRDFLYDRLFHRQSLSAGQRGQGW